MDVVNTTACLLPCPPAAISTVPNNTPLQPTLYGPPVYSGSSISSTTTHAITTPIPTIGPQPEIPVTRSHTRVDDYSETVPLNRLPCTCK